VKTSRGLLIVAVLVAFALGIGVGLRLGRDEGEKPDPDAPPPKQQVQAPAADMEALLGLPYVGGTFDPDADQSGVLQYERGKVQPGLNFFNSRRQNEALLMDMKGRTVYRWSYPGEEWQSARLLPNGEIVVLIKDERLFGLDRDSNLLWSYEGRVHHDFWFDTNGEIYVLSREPRLVPEIHPTEELLADTIVILSPDGEPRETISLVDVLRGSPYAYLLPSVSQVDFASLWDKDEEFHLDLLHTNHVEVFDGRLEDRSPLFRKGNMLVSIRNMSSILILDGETREVVWLWGPGNLTYQHHPTLLDSGNILVFDNGASASRVVELDPEGYRVVWSFSGGEEFFSKTRGSCLRLANGNTLVTESDTGYVFEVTPSGEVVWEYANPDVDEEGVRQAIWRMYRVSPESLEFLEDSQASPEG
jgi:hypothetical protein